MRTSWWTTSPAYGHTPAADFVPSPDSCTAQHYSSAFQIQRRNSPDHRWRSGSPVDAMRRTAYRCSSHRCHYCIHMVIGQLEIQMDYSIVYRSLAAIDSVHRLSHDRYLLRAITVLDWCVCDLVSEMFGFHACKLDGLDGIRFFFLVRCIAFS